MIRIATLTAALFAAAALMAPALAQDASPAEDTPALSPLTPEESAALEAALQDDTATTPRATKPLKIPGQSQANHFGVTRSAQPSRGNVGLLTHRDLDEGSSSRNW